MARQYQDTETRRRQVAEAALITLVEDGAARFTTRAVAERVGISDGTLFRHFGSKQEVVLEAMGVLEESILASFQKSDDALDDLQFFFKHRAKFVGSENAVGALIFSDELLHLAGEEGREQVASWRKRSLKHLNNRLNSLKKSDQLKPDIPTSGMAMLIQGTLLTFVLQRSVGDVGSEAAFSRRITKSWNVLSSVLFR